jgi:stage V sporulation protein B
MKYPIRETSLLTISSVVTRVVAVVFTVILARALSVSDFGLFKYLLTVASFYSIILAGPQMAATKFIGAAHGDRQAIIGQFAASSFLNAIMFILLTIVIAIFSDYKVFVILLLFSLLIDNYYLALIRGILNYSKLLGYKLVENIIQLVLLLGSFVIYGTIDLGLAIVYFSFAGVVSLLLFELVKPEFISFSKISKITIIQQLRFSIPVVLGNIGWTVFIGVNTIYIARFLSNDSVAYFGVASTIVQAFSFLPDAITTIILPKVAGSNDKSKIVKPLNIAILGCLAASGLILILLVFFQDFIVLTVFSKSYSPALGIIIPMALAQVIISIHQIFAAVWQGLGKPGIPSITISIGAAFNLIAGYFLTKSMGITGAVLSFAMSSLIATLIISYLWYRWRNTLAPLLINGQENIGIS